MTTTADNRALTLKGMNRLFAAVGIEIKRHHLKIYEASHRGLTYEDRTLEGIGQQLLLALQAEQPEPHITNITRESYPGTWAHLEPNPTAVADIDRAIDDLNAHLSGR